ncbi:hybrid sensor histidine kinase/response regulator [Anaeromicropila herbilytica]|uniref:Stage 0 sporulation protein A homolog n=1 Tax=Anaeromicropila herbilytica TaxID=2785025 RepID=A0A7R7ENC3_9FIRM|nr:ATP-binding protein [Anaeromicropila herbilytica]BCN31963.1 hypothetical protein bsdtb5_32580 [Anaeromicropila herbilytica]
MNSQKLHKYLCSVFLIIIALSIIYPIVKSQTSKSPLVKNGVLDLTDWSFHDNQTVKLNGKWEFYFNQLLSPSDFTNNTNHFTYQEVPSRWDRYTINGKPLSSKGCATYRLKLKLPSDEKHYGIKITSIFSSSKIFVNGEEIYRCGIPGTSEESTSHEFYADTVYFTTDKSNTEIVIQVSNYLYAYNGIFYPIYFGPEKAITHQRILSVLIDGFFIIGMLLMSIYTFGISFQRKNRIGLLFFAGYCLASALYKMTCSEVLLNYLFPNISFTFCFQFQAFSILAEYYLLFLFAYYAFKVQYKGLKKLVHIIACFFLCLTLFTKFYLWSYTYILFFITTLLLIILITYIFYNQFHIAVIGKTHLYLAMICSVLLFIECFFNIVLGLESDYFPPIVQPIFVFALSFYMSENYSVAFETIETLSARLTQLDKLKDDFLAKTSHELKTPLNGIINISESLLDGSGGTLNEEQYEDLSLITNIGKRLSNLVYDILDYSKLKNGALSLHLTIIDIYPVIDSTLNIFQYLIKGKIIEFDNQVPSNTYFILADENRFKQIVFNLLDNAVKFTPKGSITISAYYDNSEVFIAVKDTGIGIPSSKLATIFYSYEQLEMNGNISTGGVGLGLSITKQLISLHNGSIFVESDIGKGSCFTVSFPAKAKNELTLKEKDEINPKVDDNNLSKEYHLPYSKHMKGKANILVVDDEYSNLKSLLNVLTLWNYNVTITDNPKTALQLLMNNRSYDLVILDIMMPFMSGYEVCRHLRIRYNFLDLPILILTAKNSPMDIQAGFHAGANDFLEKPFDSKELECRVNTLIQLKKSKELLLERETAFLQAQIKPHFLFNALNTINSFCYSNPEQASKLLMELGVFLRGSFDFKSTATYVTLEKELRLVKAYVSIEKARYDNRLEIDYQYDSSILKYSILPLTIQPIVENSIRHGIMKRIGGGLIQVRITTDHDDIFIEVSDNGIGMDQTMISSLLSEKPIGDGVGLYNINCRLLNYYNTSLRITSNKDQGTLVSFHIPMQIK